MAVLTITKPAPLTGTDPVFQTPTAAGDTFPNQPVLMHLRNANTTTARTVTIKSFAKPGPGVTVTDIAIPVPAASQRVVRGFGGQVTNDPDTGNVVLTYDSVADLTIALVEG
jgi:hypothetical protein